MPEFLLLPIIATAIAQLSKFFIKSNQYHLSWRALIAYSGMPSSHAAATISLTTIIGLTQGFNSPLFAVTLVFSLITLRDASGLRRHVGRQAAVLNEINRELDDEALLEEKMPNLLEKIGHTPMQIIIGSLIGFLVSFCGWLIMGL